MTDSNSILRRDHNRITPTARMVAHLRSFSDIPYAKEVSAALRGEEAARQIFQGDFDTATRFCGPFLEARYKSFKRFIDAHSNVLELAVGTSVERGLSISDDPDNIYVGTDLPEMIKDSKAFFTEITNNKKRTNHHLEAANVLSYEELNAAARHFGVRRKVLIISEGLWTYLTTEEQIVCAENVRRILAHWGGIWVTPDIIDAESCEQCESSLEPETKSLLSRISKNSTDLTGRDCGKNFFANKQEAMLFFYESGFNVNQYSMVDDPESVTSIKELWGERERRVYEPLLRKALVWVVSLR